MMPDTDMHDMMIHVASHQHLTHCQDHNDRFVLLLTAEEIRGLIFVCC
jgi:hypothetical protein